jgi:hypothetical protein
MQASLKLTQQVNKEAKNSRHQAKQDWVSTTKAIEGKYGLKLNTTFSPFRNAIQN